MKKEAALAAFILFFTALAAGLAHAADKSLAVAALVMELTGATEPPLAVHREVAAGTSIALVPGSRLSLLHYATCSIVTFSGGTVKVGEQGLEAAEVNIESRKPGPCPHAHKISLAGPGPLGGGIVARGMHPNTEYADVAPDGLVVITGAGAANARSADVLDSNRMLVDRDIPIRRESFRLSGVLPPRRPYYINIHFQGRSEPVEVPISISAASDAKGLLILRLE